MRTLILATLPCLLAAAPAPETVTTRADQQALAITVYSGNLALVRDQRQVKLGKGDQALAFQEVSAQMRPETALLRNLTNPKDFWVIEQNFDFDLLTPAKLLEKYVGETVTVVQQRPKSDGAGSVSCGSRRRCSPPTTVWCSSSRTASRRAFRAASSTRECRSTCGRAPPSC